MGIDFKRMGISAALSFVSEEDIENGVKELTAAAFKQTENYPLRPEDGETDHTIMIFPEDGILYFTIAIVNKNIVPMQILRFLETRPLPKTATEIFKVYKDAISKAR